MGSRERTGKACRVAVLVAAACLAGFAEAAMAAGRVALVIGNGDYARFGDLRNPANDALAMGEKLQALGFSLVGGQAHVDVERRAMARLLGDLEDALAAPGAGATALVYYSGHGVAEAGSNWLVPVDDGDIRYREDVPAFAIAAREVMRRLEGRGGGLNILILDACRNNPLPSRRKTKGALSKGLARMNAPSNTVIVYAAAPGQVAYDGQGRLSPFTGALLAEMDRPGQRLMDVLGATAKSVERETSGMPQGRQEPWLELKPLQRPFYFVPPPVAEPGEDVIGAGGTEASGSVSDRVAAEQLAARRLAAEEELMFWGSIKDSRNPADFEEYRKRYGEGGKFAGLVRNRLAVLAGGGVAVVPAGEAAPVGDVAESQEPEPVLERDARKVVQMGLARLGYGPGPVDGDFGPRTLDAVTAWQEAKGYEATGRMTVGQARVLMEVGEEALAEETARREREAERQRKAEAKRLAREGARKEPGYRFRDCEECPELVVVPAGSYMMGSPESEAERADEEGPRHRVTIARPFAVGVTEVTRGEFGRFVRETGHSTGNACWTYEGGEWNGRSGRGWRNPGFSQTDAHPVVCVSWEDAQAYLRWLSRETGKRYRLLSESEWEYAARAGTGTSRYWGNGESGQCAHANGADRALKRRYSDWEWSTASCDDGHIQTAPVGSFAANGYGLRDVLGNVWEWVEDCWHESYTGAPSDGGAWTGGGDCERRVLRGGSWNFGPRYVRSADRYRYPSG